MIVRCCCCQKVRVGAKWVDSDERHSTKTPVSHGYCPACAAKAFAEVEEAIRKSSIAV